MGRNNRAPNERAHVCKSDDGRMCLGSTRGMDISFSMLFYIYVFVCTYQYSYCSLRDWHVLHAAANIVLELMTAFSIDFHCIFIVIHLEYDAYFMLNDFYFAHSFVLSNIFCFVFDWPQSALHTDHAHANPISLLLCYISFWFMQAICVFFFVCVFHFFYLFLSIFYHLTITIGC